MSKDGNFVGFWSYEEVMAKLDSAKRSGAKSVSYFLGEDMKSNDFARPFIHNGYPVSVRKTDDGVEVIVHLTDDWW